jgi:membrane AbrB-like protein
MGLLPAISVAICLGLVGAFLMNRLGLPAGGLTGTILGVGVGLSLFGFPEIDVPGSFRAALQVFAGTLVGLRITRDSLSSGARYILPATLTALAFMLAGSVAAFIATRITDISAQTALFAAMPGGMTEMASVAASLGADGASVAAVHMCRILLVTLLAGLLISALKRRNGGKQSFSEAEAPPESGSGEERGSPGRRLMLAAVLGVIGGVAGLMTGLPAGGVFGALVGSAAVRLTTGGHIPTSKLQLGLQVVAGVLIGLGISQEFLRTLGDLAWATGVILGIQMLTWVVLAYATTLLTSRDSMTALFSGAPGGLTELSTAASAAGADSVIVAFTHLMRLTLTIVLAPILISLLLGA